jgi:hypothetical protein
VVEAAAEAAEAAEAAAVAGAPHDAAPPSRDSRPVRDGGARAPGLDRYRCEFLVCAAAPVRVSTALDPEAAKFPGSGVLPEPGRPGLFATRIAALGGFWLQPRSERRGSASSAAVRERISGIRCRKRQKSRLVIGYSLVNECLDGRSFRMDQLADLSPSLRPDDCLFKADIKDAYYHVRLQKEDQLYLAFRVGGVTYIPNCLN